MIKKFNIPVTEKIQIFQVWLASINWTFGKNQLTEAELEMLSYFLYYNDVYKTIKEKEVRMDLLFSTTIKNKIKKEFSVSTHKMETYLNKLRKKNVIEKNIIDDRFIIYPGDSLEVSFNCKIENRNINNSNVIVDTPVVPESTNEISEQPIQDIRESNEILEDELDEEYPMENVNYSDPFERFFTDDSNNNIPSWM